ncbi:right-handed parallel beta-helix repeat-containing protein [Enhygromyxa salina]|nr:right-handed parallel beta-helix repeat-containing protein [Enhygromyxa salina]
MGNAAPLYRVSIGVGGKIVTLLNRPRDKRLQPKAGQIIELIPWGSKLPHGETAAEMTGELIRVAKSYDPATGQLVLSEAPTTSFVTWQTQQRGEFSGVDTTSPSHVYMRLWSRGGDLESDILLDIANVPVPLGNTGLQVQLTGAGQVGDYWIIAARRATPEQVVPWELLTSQAPHGPHRYYAPLAVICWEAPLRYMTGPQKDEFEPSEIAALQLNPQLDDWAVWGPVRANILDARRRLQRLCCGCGTILVGDGIVSHGMVDSIDDALALLPAAGGRIHLLPGLHVGEIRLESVKNITISGCSLESQIVTDTPVALGASLAAQGDPVIELVDCENIVLKDFVVRATSAVGIKLSNEIAVNRNIHIQGIRFHAIGQWVGIVAFALSRSAILGLGGKRITIENCRVDVDDNLNYVPAIVLGGSDIRIIGNHIEAGPIGVAQSMGGLQILSYSQHVEITDNLIRGGWGHGISLGHLINVDVSGPGPYLTLDAETSWANLDRTLGDAISNLRQYQPGLLPVTTQSDEYWTPGGPVIGVCIRDNRIFDKGLSGISTGGFVNTQDPGRVRFIVAIDIEIHRNEIVGNMQVDSLGLTSLNRFDACVGGVCLAAVINLLVHENRIINNGVDYDTPTVGVGVVTGQGVVLHDNVIADNGIAHDTVDTEITHVGLRGGIAFAEVVGTRGYTFLDAIPGVTVDVPDFTLYSNNVALTVRKNEISQRVGKVVWVLSGFGPIVVQENCLHGLGDPVTSVGVENSEICYTAANPPPLIFTAQGACVEIRGYASSPLVDYGTGILPGITFGDTDPPVRFEGGPIEFDSNEVSLNWHWEDGYACSVLLSSLDTVKVTNNVMSVNMNSTHIPIDPGGDEDEPSDITFPVDAAAEPPPEGMSYLFVNCWAGASSTVQATGNRFEERRFDCMFSYLGAHAAAFGESDPDIDLTKTNHASLTMMNVGSHCMVAPNPGGGPPSIINTDNVSVYEVVMGCPSTGNDTIFGAKQRVCII